MQKILDNFSWGFLLAFLIPSVLIIASWNALPSDRLYGAKLALESALLLLARSSYAADGALNVKYTERRFAETARLLADKHSIEGLPYLERQVAATKAVIDRAPSEKSRKQLAQTYLVTLRNVVAQLEQEKQAGVPTPSGSSRVTQKRLSPESSSLAPPQPEPSSENIAEEIENTQEEIKTTIEELEEITQTEPEQGEFQQEEESEEQKENHGNNSQGDGPPERANQGQGQGKEQEKEKDRGGGQGEEHGKND